MDTRPTDNLDDFPRMLKKPVGQRLAVQNAAELEAALADGWLLHIFPENRDPDEADPRPAVATVGAADGPPDPPAIDPGLDGFGGKGRVALAKRK